MNEAIALALSELGQVGEYLTFATRATIDGRSVAAIGEIQSAVFSLTGAVKNLMAVAASLDERIARLEMRDNKRGW